MAKFGRYIGNLPPPTSNYFNVFNPKKKWYKWVRRRLPWTPAEILEFFTVKQNTPEWHKLRQKVVGASTLGGLIGTSDYTTPKWLIRKLLNMIRIDEVTYDEVTATYAMNLGHKYEPVIAWMIEQIYGLKLEDVGIVVNNKFIDFGISPDGYVSDVKAKKRLFEIKFQLHVVLSTPSWAYITQVQAQMTLMEIETCYLVCFSPKDYGRFNVFKIKRSQEFWEKLVMPRMNKIFEALETADYNFEAPWSEDETEQWMSKLTSEPFCKTEKNLQVQFKDFVYACMQAEVDPSSEFDILPEDYKNESNPRIENKNHGGTAGWFRPEFVERVAFIR
jgi:hypothetical protein